MNIQRYVSIDKTQKLFRIFSENNVTEEVITIAMQNYYRQSTYLLKVAFFQKVRCVFQISKKKNTTNHYPELEI